MESDLLLHNLNYNNPLSSTTSQALDHNSPRLWSQQSIPSTAVLDPPPSIALTVSNCSFYRLQIDSTQAHKIKAISQVRTYRKACTTIQQQDHITLEACIATLSSHFYQNSSWGLNNPPLTVQHTLAIVPSHDCLRAKEPTRRSTNLLPRTRLFVTTWSWLILSQKIYLLLAILYSGTFTSVMDKRIVLLLSSGHN